MNTKTLLALFTGLFVGLGIGLVVGALAAWMWAENLHSRGSANRPFKRTAAQLPQWNSTETAAADSVEGLLRAQGTHWVRTVGEISVGDYVQDIYEGRLGQPKGRGAIGKVVTVIRENDRTPAAMVDFDRKYIVGINLTELSIVRIESKEQ